MSSTPRRRNLRGHGALLRDEILSAAIRVIDGADSEGEVSLRSIAREAGIAAPSVYAHFDDRDRVLEAVAESSWVRVSEEIAEHVQAATDPRERLLIGCRVYVSFAQRHPLRYALMTQDGQAPPAARQALATVTRALLACRGEPPSSLAEPADAASDPDSDRIAAALSVALHGVAMLHRTDSPNLWLSDFTTDEVIRTLVDAATRLLVDAAPA
ncbi:TetR/AcrR family transcriptional regulator [[Mycobacterium] crassicus]|uniref:TetR/AcrR family transcriptional regulator n=1 Tax=[Mycobacterium] crassicus TaxID=2872309 RepID=A0ABU5XQ86_9MYCO|nr:TetR/AcrR family transcriptional regulator [Mycolicibacter sp. MYC098]MEB3023492.1 TetR/AcrR family transcriptional regulator [Mycolicibacter sp. MYC098]